MKVTENSAERLRLDHVPWTIAMILLGMALVFSWVGINALFSGQSPMSFIGVAFVIVALVFFVERTQLWADRGTDTFAVRKRNWRGQTEQRYRLANIVRAQVDTTTGSKGKRTHRPVLLMEDGREVPLRNIYISGNDAHDTVDVVNRWLNINTH